MSDDGLFEFDLPDQEDLKEATFDALEEPGTYHFVVGKVLMGQYPGGRNMNSNGFFTQCEVVGGTVDGQNGKSHGFAWYAPKMSSKDGGKFQAKKLHRFSVACDLNKPDAGGTQAKLRPKDAEGRQFIAKVVRETYEKDGQERTKLELSYTDIWHVDDPKVAGVPKNGEMLSVYADEHRHPGEYFDPLYPAKSKSNGTPAPAPTAPAPAASELTADDVDGL